MKIDGKYLRKLRQGRGLSLRALADKIYVSKSTLQRWELSHVPEEDEEVCARLAKALGVGVEELYAGDITSAKRSVSPEKLAEMKFGVKGLAAALIALGVLLVAGIVLIFAIV